MCDFTRKHRHCGRVYKQFVYHLKIAPTIERGSRRVEVEDGDFGRRGRKTIHHHQSQSEARSEKFSTRDEFELLLAHCAQIDILRISLLSSSIHNSRSPDSYESRECICLPLEQSLRPDQVVIVYLGVVSLKRQLGQIMIQFNRFRTHTNIIES